MRRVAASGGDVSRPGCLSVDGWSGDAEFSADGRHRYALTRFWTSGEGTTVFVMLNPSTASAMANDPTVRRCCGYARDWGRRRLIVVNLFALVSTAPEVLYQHADPTGDPQNLETILHWASDANTREVVCAWGAHGRHLARGARVLRKLREIDGVRPLAFKLTENGEPQHPLYLPADLRPVPITELRP